MHEVTARAIDAIELIYTNNEEIVEQLNKHFINVGPNLASTIDKTMKILHNISRHLQLKVLLWKMSKKFRFLTCSNKLSIDIPNKLIKIAAEPLSVPFTQIYNQSIETGIVPNILKVSQVTPAYESEDATDPANYRPISTLSSFR